MKKEKINQMNYKTIESTFVSSKNKIDVVRDLLSDSWVKKNKSEFYKTRNNYTIELNGKNHPLWIVKVYPKNDLFDENDWKLRQDYKSIKNLGKKLNKNLYINENNVEEIQILIETMLMNGFRLIYSDNYVLVRENSDTLSIFKIAAKARMKGKEDGWYVGKKKVL